MEMNNKKLTFLKYFSCALIVIVFAIVLFINYARYNAVYAADYAAGEVCNGFSFSGATSYENAVLKVSATGESGGLCGSDKAGNATLTVKNTLSDPGTISFNYTVSVNGGSIKIDGSSVTTNGSFSKEVAAGASFKIEITTKKGANTTYIDLTTIKASFAINANITFQAADLGGKYTVQYAGNTHEIISTVTEPISAEDEISFKAIPEDGYKLYYWIINGSKINGAVKEFSASYINNTTIKPVFCEKNAAIFTTKEGGEFFTSLTAANNFAKTASKDGKVIVPVETDTMILAGNYEISSGVTLLIPFDDSNVFSSTTPVATQNDWVKPTVFRKLILESGVHIICNGSICVNSKVAAKGQSNGHNATPTGAHGTIEMKDESKITFNSGAFFYCWGYTIGSGTVEMKSGSIIYECFQIRDWPGGSNALGLEGNSQKVFLFSQYYIQNVEAHLLFNQGAKEYCYTCVYMGSQLVDTTVQIVGSTSDKTLFRISEGKIDKFFDTQRDILQISIYGNATISSIKVTMKVSFYGADIDSANYVLPLNGNIHIIVKNGGTFSTNQNFGMLPGSKITVENGGVFNVNNSIYLYDINSWTYNDGEKNHYFVFNEVKYTALDYFGDSYYKDGFKINTRNKNACIDINGTVSVSGNGKLYTTNMVDGSYADVISSEKTGSIRLNGENSTQVYQFFAGSTSNKVEIPCIQVKLKNGDSSYYDGDVTKIITYNALLDVWGDGGIITATIRFVYGSTTKDYQYSSNEPFVFPNFDIFGETQYSIKRWITSDWNHNFLINESTEDLVLQQGDILVFNPFFGGFITLLNNNDWYYVDYFAEDGNTFVKGLYRTRTLSGDSIKIHYFSEETGELLSVSNDSDIGLIEWNNNLYYLDNNGYVKEFLGLVEYLNNYYYFGEENKAYRDGVYFIETNNETYPSGFYRFDADGHLVGKITHGLVETSNGDLYYIDSTNDSSVDLDNINPASSYVVTNSTIYVTDFDLSVSQSNKKVGLYYFGEDGKMMSYKEVA